jgi:hypothetical protein
MKTIEFYSWEQQDEFIINLFKHKTDGIFLDISAAHPRVGSNSYTLEKSFSWKGHAFDIIDVHQAFGWNNIRSTPFIQQDATSESLTQFLKDNYSNQVIDYISLDVDAHDTNLALPVLKRILDAGIRFKALTFEHELYMHGPATRDESRQLLESLGYVRLFGDVCAWGAKPDRFKSGEYFEDWWVDPQYFDAEILAVASEKTYTFDCVNKLRIISGVEYTANHMCCRAFPNEWCIWLNEADEAWWRWEYEKLKSYDISRFI